MAHECPSCYRDCHCGGDIDNINFGVGWDCDCAYSEWGCGSELDDEDDDYEYDDY